MPRRPKLPESNTFGYKLWSVLFTLSYPLIAVFTFGITLLLSIFSGISSALVWVFTKIKK